MSKEEKIDVLLSDLSRNLDTAFMILQAKPLTLLYPFIDREDKPFLTFFHLLRNSMVHYDGNHNVKNRLDYDLNGFKFKSTEANFGKQIIWSIEAVFDLFQNVKRIYSNPDLVRNISRVINK